MTRAERVIKFIETYCVVPEGRFVGKPVCLDEFQREFILDVYDNPHITDTAILSMARKNAKALCLDTPIPTPQGWKAMGDIIEGDTVYGADGLPAKVVATSGIFTNKECFELNFSDGSLIIASADHLWETKHKYRPWKKSTYQNGTKRGKEGFNCRPVVDVVTTKQIHETLTIPRSDNKKEYNHSIKINRHIEGSLQDLPIDPYLLGLWLGDGASRDASLTVGPIDEADILDRIKSVLPSANITKNKDRASTIYLSDVHASWHDQRSHSVSAKLKKLNLIKNKHIPEIYIKSLYEQRLKLLQGLMDSDGTVDRCGGKTTSRACFSNKSKNLIDDVWILVRSLGLKGRIRKYKASYNGIDCGFSYKLSFSASKDIAIFSLPRKQKLLPESLGARTKNIQITNVKSVGVRPCKCISVDSQDNLFLAGKGYIPTHNTGLIAFLVIVHLVGPEAVLNSRIISGAMSKEQAAEVYNLASKCVLLSPSLSEIIRLIPSTKKLIGMPMNVEYQAISADKTTAHGKSPIVAILDEVGQIRGPRSDFVDAITTAQGAYENPLLIYISTQAATDADFFSLIIDDALTNKPPKTVCHLHAADDDAELNDRAQWKKANPAMGTFRSESDMKKQAEKASRMPSFENTFRNLHLNQRVSSDSPFVSRSVWEAGNKMPPPMEGFELYGGLDLSLRLDLTAAVFIGSHEDNIYCWPHFWTPEEGLKDRADRDKQPYDVWVKQGFLRTCPGHAVDYEFVATDLRDIVGSNTLLALAFDRWKMKFMKKDCDRLGIEFPFVEFGQGYKDMSPALESTEEYLLNEKIWHGGHPVLRMCASNAIAIKDPAGNRKLDKSKPTGRIDGIVALTMAIGMITREFIETSVYEERGILFV